MNDHEQYWWTTRSIDILHLKTCHCSQVHLCVFQTCQTIVRQRTDVPYVIKYLNVHQVEVVTVRSILEKDLTNVLYVVIRFLGQAIFNNLKGYTQ